MNIFTKLLLVLSVSLLISLPSYAISELSTKDFSQLPDVSNLVLSPSGNKLASTVRVNVGDVQGVAVQVTDIASKKTR